MGYKQPRSKGFKFSLAMFPEFLIDTFLFRRKGTAKKFQLRNYLTGIFAN